MPRTPKAPQPTFTEPDPAALQQPTAGPQSARPGPRRGRKPQWTKLKPTIAHLYEDINDRLTDVIEATGMGLQETFEEAINTYCDALRPPIPAEMPEDADLKLPRDPNQPPPGTPADRPTAPPAVVRLQPNTRARLVAACNQEKMGGKAVINDAIEAYLDELDMD
ncbi:hypothetical protein [Nonomuraea basaltis]|uniref:hypothetical protein n=1 Tax=Nonomuraea basaltis TaxID=2495887 RepID=UPI00110C48CA|nr:hypothetical protein [Nonomuraea basaltis]TMR92832.1 hypothetical protein EJK15_42520 [Nonomuraea basaltis]